MLADLPTSVKWMAERFSLGQTVARCRRSAQRPTQTQAPSVQATRFGTDTFERLTVEHEAFVGKSLAGIARRFGFLKANLDGGKV